MWPHEQIQGQMGLGDPLALKEYYDHYCRSNDVTAEARMAALAALQGTQHPLTGDEYALLAAGTLNAAARDGLTSERLADIAARRAEFEACHNTLSMMTRPRRSLRRGIAWFVVWLCVAHSTWSAYPYATEVWRYMHEQSQGNCEREQNGL